MRRGLNSFRGPLFFLDRKLLGLRAWCFVDAQGSYHGLSQQEMVRHCKSAERIEVHHLKPRSLGREDSTKNCISLCGVCHAERHAYRLFIHGEDANKGVRFEAVK